VTEKRGSILPLQRKLSKNFAEFQAPFFQGGANPKSKIQNPKSGDPLVENAKLLFFYHKFY
jgi:hypothetical protein